MTTSKAPCTTEGLPAPVRILRMAEVIHTVGLSRATIYRLIAQGTFPPQVSLTSRSVGWWHADISRWLDDRLDRSTSLSINV